MSIGYVWGSNCELLVCKTFFFFKFDLQSLIYILFVQDWIKDMSICFRRSSCEHVFVCKRSFYSNWIKITLLKNDFSKLGHNYDIGLLGSNCETMLPRGMLHLSG